MADYKSTSPYFTTPIKGFYLDIQQYRSLPKFRGDLEYTILDQYQYRPDLLAYDFYDDQNLWWVFAVRNPDILKDPVYDLTAGITIFLPTKENLQKYLGL